MLEPDGMPHDPFEGEVPDLTSWGAHCRSMYLGLLASGFTEGQSLEFTIRVMTAMMIAKMLRILWMLRLVLLSRFQLSW